MIYEYNTELLDIYYSKMSEKTFYFCEEEYKHTVMMLTVSNKRSAIIKYENEDTIFVRDESEINVF